VLENIDSQPLQANTTYKKKHYSLAKFLDTAKTSYITQDAFPMQDNEINNECIANAKK
jgi:hypothetical protein